MGTHLVEGVQGKQGDPLHVELFYDLTSNGRLARGTAPAHAWWGQAEHWLILA